MPSNTEMNENDIRELYRLLRLFGKTVEKYKDSWANPDHVIKNIDSVIRSIGDQAYSMKVKL